MAGNKKQSSFILRESILLIVSCAIGIVAAAQPVLNTREVDQLIEKQMKRWKVPGVAIAIVKGSEVLYAKGYGYRNIENKLPVTPNTIFKIASLTKSFTAAAAGILVEQKLLSWDAPVKGYLPQLVLANKELTNDVTLRDLLSHRTGLYDDDWSWVGDHIDRNRMYEILSAMPQQAPLRKEYIYSNMTYALVGELLAMRSGNSWRNLVRQYFFQPLSMSHSGFSHTENSGWDDFAYGYEVDSLGSYTRGNLSEHCTDSLSVCEAFGFISSSAMDLSKWVRLFILGGNWKGKQIIPPGSFIELIRPVNFVHGPGEKTQNNYAMGWEQDDHKGHRLLQHSGGLTGFKSYMSFMPGDSIGIVILTNGQPYRFPKAITYDLYDMLLGLAPTAWSAKWFVEDSTRAKMPAPVSINIAGTAPTHPLAAYAGTYHSIWLGDMKVFFENGELYFQFHTYPKEKMKHAHYDTFYTEPQRSPGSGISFRMDHDGKINSMMLNEFVFEKIR